MNDMAFGGGSEMLRDGDLTGHWALVEAGMRFYCPFPTFTLFLKHPYRIFTLIGHLPWLARFIMLIPGSTNDLDNMRKACFERAIARKKKGAEQKDLFYYLVGVHDSLSGPLSGAERFQSPTNSVRKKKKYLSKLLSTMATLLLSLVPTRQRRSSHPSSSTSFATRRSSLGCERKSIAFTLPGKRCQANTFKK